MRAVSLYIGGMGAYYHALFCRYGYEENANLVRGLYNDGDRQEAAAAVSDDLIDAIAICGAPEHCREQLGDFRQWGDSTTLLAEGALISGDLQTSLTVEKKLLEDARRRRNPLQTCMALFGVSSIYIRMGRYSDAIPMLEEELQILEELPNMASSICTNAQLALAHYRLGHVEKALSYAARDARAGL